MNKLIFFCLAVFSSLQGTPSAQDILIAKENMLDAVAMLRGWCTQEKSTAIFNLVLTAQPKICVEIGVFNGASLISAAMALKLNREGIIIGIDPWNSEECIKYFDPIERHCIKYWKRFDMEQLYENYLQSLQLYELNPYVRTLRKTSFEAASEIGAIDILHIDGNFGGEMPLRDLQMYVPKVKSGGYILFHDMQRSPAQIQCLRESCNMVGIIDQDVGAPTLLFKKR